MTAFVIDANCIVRERDGTLVCSPDSPFAGAVLACNIAMTNNCMPHAGAMALLANVPVLDEADIEASDLIAF